VLYSIIFAVWPPSVWSTRIPVVLIGAARYGLLFYLLLSKIGIRAAVIGSAILATDCLFLLTTCFDWGPVAIQHLLLVAAMLLFVRFHESGSAKALAAGAFCLGLGLWDKAIFAWSIAGLAAACLAVCPRALMRRFSLRHAGIAAASFVVGAFRAGDLHVAHPLETARESSQAASTGRESHISSIRWTAPRCSATWSPYPWANPFSPAHSAAVDVAASLLALPLSGGRLQGGDVVRVLFERLAGLRWRMRRRGFRCSHRAVVAMPQLLVQ
jgi:hypothetical protein